MMRVCNSVYVEKLGVTYFVVAAKVWFSDDRYVHYFSSEREHPYMDRLLDSHIYILQKFIIYT